MKKIIAAVLVAFMVTAMFPGSSNAFGILRVIYDGIANQLGLDRGSIPKAVAKPQPQTPDQMGTPQPRNPESHGPYIRAEGF
jgi:hypothetical protein